MRWEDTNRDSILYLTRTERVKEESVVVVGTAVCSMSIFPRTQNGHFSCPQTLNAGDSIDAARVPSTRLVPRVPLTPPAYIPDGSSWTQVVFSASCIHSSKTIDTSPQNRSPDCGMLGHTSRTATLALMVHAHGRAEH